jgi:hypothetical protein
MALVSISSNVLSLRSVTSDIQVPENVCPLPTLAGHVPCQPRGDFRADHVPSRRIWFVSLRRVHEPLAALGVVGSRLAHHRPRNECAGPAVAIQVPRQLCSLEFAERSCAATYVQISTVTTQSHGFQDILVIFSNGRIARRCGSRHLLNGSVFVTNLSRKTYHSVSGNTGCLAHIPGVSQYACSEPDVR